MIVRGNNQFRNLRLSFFKFITDEFAKTTYARNEIMHRGENELLAQTDNVHCRYPDSCNRLDCNKIINAVGQCNCYTCPDWMPTMINYDEPDYKAQDQRIVRIDFLSRDMSMRRFDVCQIGIWSNKGDDPFKHKLTLLRDVVVDILTNKEFELKDFDTPTDPPPLLDGRPQERMFTKIHI